MYRLTSAGAQDLQQPFERQYNGDDLFPENPSVNEAWQQALFWASVERHELIRPALEHRHPTEIADTDIYSHQQRGPNGGYAQELCQKDRDLEPAQRARQLDSVAYDVLTPSRPDAMGYEPPNSRYRDAERVVQGGHRSHYGRADYPEWHIDDESRLAQDNNYVLGLEQTRSEDREARRRRRHHHHHHRHHHHQQR